MKQWMNRRVIGTHIGVTRMVGTVKSRFAIRDERGDVAPRTIGIAVMAALAVAVGAIITQKITGLASDIDIE